MAKTIKKSLLLLAYHQGTLWFHILYLFYFKKGHLGNAVAFCSGIALSPESQLSQEKLLVELWDQQIAAPSAWGPHW